MYKELNDNFARNLGLSECVFDRPTIVIELPTSQAHRKDSVAAYILAANLLTRMFSRVHLVAPDIHIENHPWKIKNNQDLLEVLTGISEGEVHIGMPERADIVLSIGGPGSVQATQSIFVTFCGWVAGLNMDVGNGYFGYYGALLAACYGSAQVFLLAANKISKDIQPLKPFQFSMLDYSGNTTNAAIPSQINLKTFHLVGVGAIGSAFTYALAHLPSANGVAHLIDNDQVGDTNLQRYVLMQRTDIPENKTDVAAKVLSAIGLTANSFPVSFGEYAAIHGSDIDLLITPVDSEAGRRQLAAYLPRSVLNAATGHSTVTVSRHAFADNKACLHCLYLTPRHETSTEKRLATDLGLSVSEVELLLAENKPVNQKLIRRVELHRNVNPGEYDKWLGQHIQSLYQRVVCGEASIPTSSGTLTAPLSFISTIAGIFLAAELVKSSVEDLAAYCLDNYFRIDTLHIPNPAFLEIRVQDPLQQCICWDKAYVEIYRRKYQA